MYNKISLILVVVLALMLSGAWSEAGHVYRSEGKRDPFIPLVGIAASSAAGGVDDVLGIEDVVFQGVVTGADGRKRVVLNGELIEEGETLGSLTVIEIGDNEIKIGIGESRHTIFLYQ